MLLAAFGWPIAIIGGIAVGLSLLGLAFMGCWWVSFKIFGKWWEDV